MAELCPRCGSELEQNNGASLCVSCGYVSGDTDVRHAEAEEFFLSGSAYLSLKDFDKAAEQFLKSASLCPSDPKNWLYLLAAVTERFTELRLIADEKAKKSAGKRKVICASVYKNLVATAGRDDYIYAKSEFDIDLDPKNEELWECILEEIIGCDKRKLPYQKASELAYVAVRELSRSHPKTAIRYFPELCERFNTVKEGVLEVNTLAFYPPSKDRILRIDTDADSIEFCDDVIDGSSRYDGFMLTEGIENIGTHFPFAELTVAEGVTRIPSKLLCFCSGLQIVRLSKTVAVIGKNAFTQCVNLRSIFPLDNVKEIGDSAFFGTSVRYLDIPSGVTKLGKDILGTKKDVSDEELARYLIKIDEELTLSSPDFNRVGQHRCGYLMRSNGKLQLVYPQRFADGKLRPLSRSDRAAFRALAYASIDGEDLKRDPITAAKDFVSDLKVKLSRKK